MYALRYFVVLASVILVSGHVPSNNILYEEWQLFKLHHSKVYGNRVEERHRYKVFLQNKLEILQHNNLFELGHKSFQLGLNEYSDLEHDEFFARMNGGTNTSIVNVHKFKHEVATFIKPDIRVPESVDWSKEGAVTDVKNQGQGGSGWAFSSTGSLESQYFLNSKKLISLSEQNLIDCCAERSVSSAFEYIKKNGGIDTEESYPYEAVDGDCRYDSGQASGVQVKGIESIPQFDEDALKLAVATHGPISVAIDASQQSFKDYSGGVYYEPECNPMELNHEVLVVGYDTTDNGQDYWIVRNSFGVTWGQDGYILMARNVDNNCGIATAAIFPLI